MMVTHGSVGEFAGGSETWVLYIVRLQQYFVVNDIKDDDKQRAVLLSICDASTYQLIWSVVSPNKLTEKTVDQIVTLMKEHFPQAISHSAIIYIQLQIVQTRRVRCYICCRSEKIVGVLQIWWLLSRDVARQTDLWDKQ